MSYYRVFTPQYAGSPNHIGLWVETEPEGSSGEIFHVVGTILQGMVYERKAAMDPEASASFVSGSKEYQGWIYTTWLDEFERVCQSIEVPGAQLALNGRPLHKGKPIRRCGEWVAEALASLIAQGVLHTDIPPSD